MFSLFNLGKSVDERGHYRPVRGLQEDDGGLSYGSDAARSRTSKAVSWMCILCIATTALNLILFGLSPSGAGTKAKAPLRRPSSYYNLDRVDTLPKTRQIVNYPILLAQVSRLEPDKVFPEDTHRYSSFRGHISPEERPFYVTSDISTIAQFRMRDFGMERCVLVVSVPTNSTGPPGQTGPSGSFIPGGYELKGDTGSVELWKLASPEEPLDIRKISYRNKPKRESLLASMNIVPGEDTRTREFSCKEDSLHTFEFVCPWKDCEVNWWQVKGNDSLGATISQLPTIAIP